VLDGISKEAAQQAAAAVAESLRGWRG
jgi:hypothetical protein